jgi:hypothetical protein
MVSRIVAWTAVFNVPAIIMVWHHVKMSDIRIISSYISISVELKIMDIFNQVHLYFPSIHPIN